MQVRFPNPFGLALPDAQAVREYQAAQGFSDAYAQFLITQNGLDFDRLEAAPDREDYLQADDETGDNHAWLRTLHHFRAGSEHYDVEDHQRENLFAAHFMVIGHDPGGNPFVEVLHGAFKGRIGSLDHELFAGCEDLEQFLEEMELNGFAAASVDEQTDMLCDEDQGLIWFHASSMDSFLQQCVFCDEDGSGFVVDEPGLDEDRATGRALPATWQTARRR
ncbi:hypothetical protein [uncultured Delftia sp.]|jgi:hypothetical protein|nr:hypothetical protein [uncultured Delftia sp.]